MASAEITSHKPTSHCQSAQTSHNPVSGQRSALAAKEGSRRKNCASEDQEFGCDMLCSIQEPKWKSWLEKGSAMKRKSKLTIATAAAVLAGLVAAAVYAQDKYSLKSPSGIAFSDFRGYEDWAVVSSARTDEVLKVIVANPTMIKAYKAGVPGSGQPFPDGSMIVKLQWKPKKSTEAPFVVDVPDVFTQAFVIEKDSKRFRKAAGGDTRCSTTKPHRTSSRPIPKAPQTADTRATRP